jgi:hypothetical protein
MALAQHPSIHFKVFFEALPTFRMPIIFAQHVLGVITIARMGDGTRPFYWLTA